MKIERSKINFSIGKNTSKNIYKVIPVVKDNLPKELESKFSDQIRSGIFSAESGQSFIDESERIIYLGLGNSNKVSIRSVAQVFLGIGEKLRKWDSVGLEIKLTRFLTKTLSPSSLVYQIANSIDLGAFPINALAKDYKEKKVSSGM